ncbi:MAG TPA: GGDEF domain-containing protein [Planctomycetota bacterium]|nr:GGDEF domain-containing protein [Planctomycetota bacterium]
MNQPPSQPSQSEPESTPAKESAARTEAAVVLVCDHRGEGTLAALAGLPAAGYQLERSTHLRESLERIAKIHPTVIVIDPLAQGGGVELGAIEKARSGERLPPVLVVADPGDPAPSLAAGRALERGSWDLVHRGAPPEEFLMRVQNLQQVASRLVEMEVWRHRAAHDDRTDLLRPHSFQERMREHISAAQRHKLDMALLLIDLDHFGKVNKLHDHTVGDLIIARVGSVIRNALRTEDVAGRIGGDEFAVLLPYTKKVDAAHVVQRLLDGIKELSGRLPGAKGDIEVSASIGFETFNGTDLEEAQTTLRLNSEAALRRAKGLGGNRGVYFRGADVGRASGLADKDQP